MSPELEHIRCEVEGLTLGWSESDWHRALPGKWTSAQILEHLRLTFIATSKGILGVMEIGRPLGSKPTLPDRLRTFWVAKLGLMPSGRTAPKQPVPGDGFEDNTLRRFYDGLVAMDATLADAERRFGVSVKLLDHPVLGPLSAKEWREFHRTHARHHLKQMAKRTRLGTPRPRDREYSH